jgi:hypothetical protein
MATLQPAGKWHERHLTVSSSSAQTLRLPACMYVAVLVVRRASLACLVDSWRVPMSVAPCTVSQTRVWTTRVVC